MAGPGNEIAAGAEGRGRLRASHADREQVVSVLKAAFVQGMLTKDELEARAGQALAARTYAELAALTADVPAGLADVVPPGRAAQAQARRPMSNAAKAGICVVIAVVVPTVLSIPAGPVVVFMFAPFYFMALLVAGAQMLASRHESRSHRGQPSPGPAAGLGGQASPRLPAAGSGRQLPPVDPGKRHTTRAQPRRHPGPALPAGARCAGGAIVTRTAPASG
jgi:Domain of unknown function (DUF1707)